jgi:hypothetical protein
MDSGPNRKMRICKVKVRSGSQNFEMKETQVKLQVSGDSKQVESQNGHGLQEKVYRNCNEYQHRSDVHTYPPLRPVGCYLPAGVD